MIIKLNYELNLLQYPLYVIGIGYYLLCSQPKIQLQAILHLKIRKMIVQLLFFICLIVSTISINQRCNFKEQFIDKFQQDNNQTDSECTETSTCNKNGYCVCDKQTFGGKCQLQGYDISSTNKQFNVTQTITYFLITPTINQYVYYQFTLCNLEAVPNNQQLLNLWYDNGNMVQPTDKNALGVDKPLQTSQGCTNLMTPFFYFNEQANGQNQILIFGIKLKNKGTLKIQLKVQQAQLFGFDVLFRIIIILISGIGVISLAGIVYCIYKCKRRRRSARDNLNQDNYDISFFDEFMPATKVTSSQEKQQICSVCLAEYKESEEVRQTSCKHLFHKICLDEWCVTNLSCPICRTSFEKSNLMHMQYLSSRNSSENSENRDVQNQLKQSNLKIIEENINRSIDQDDIIDDENLRKPMV